MVLCASSPDLNHNLTQKFLGDSQQIALLPEFISGVTFSNPKSKIQNPTSKIA
jgi:hypothetical protein